jgi:hypothetical protein
MDFKVDLKPWAVRPFELIYHAEIHLRRGDDYDRRLALISFDNSIEVSITTYLTLNPIQRNGRQYTRHDVDKWLKNYHTKLDFFLEENQQRGLPEYKGKDEIVWFHDQRNKQYHSEGYGVPEQSTLDGIRQAALWVFDVLFESSDVKEKLETAISNCDRSTPSIPQDYVVPDKVIVPAYAPALVTASLVGKWDESNDADMGIVRRLVDGV